ncbi:MAG: PLP-dependent aminotransferase family protein [Tepidisphaeraceae bacterium]|jgi:2-aminoadipate transaminase
MLTDGFLPEPGFSAKARRTGEQPISFLMAAVVANPLLINLAAGLVDPLTLPVEAVRAIAAKILGDEKRGRQALQYDTTQGLAELRRAALKHLEKLEGKSAGEFGVGEKDLIVTTGSQQALYLIGDVLVDPGDIVIAANPCYFVYTGTLASFGATVLTAPMREDGIDVDGVENLLERLKREGRLEKVKLIYVTSYYQNPTGLTLCLEGRKRLLEIAKRFSIKRRILILEDAAYRELRYDGEALPSIKSFDPRNEFTILTQTFSKPFAPGLKTGYSVLPREVLEAVVHQKGNHDFGSSSLTQHIALEALESGLYGEQVRRLVASYRAKRDAMLGALEKHMPREAGIAWTRPEGGLYVWVTLPGSVDTSRGGALFDDCVGRGAIYVPGEYCFQADESGRIAKNFMRLSFGQVAPEQIEPGIGRLAEAVSARLGQMATAL